MPAPQRFLANDRNVFRAAAVAASAVRAINDAVLELPLARAGTAQAALSGAYTGAQEADYELEVLDATVATKSVSASIFSGKGSGTLEHVGITTAAPQTFTVELGDAGTPTTFAGLDFDGVALRARASGSAGNAVTISIDQAPLTFTSTSFSLLAQLAAGSGGDTTGLEGPAYDWQTAAIGADGIIPSSAKRVAFGDDRSHVYLQYKAFSDGKWRYHFVPEIAIDVPQGAAVYFVTGGRTITVDNGVATPEPYPGIVTLYDFLNALKTTSALVEVLGVVAFDRSPTGQAARELLTRTDAHAEPSSGSGSSYATGLSAVAVASGAATELVRAVAFAVTQADNPLAHLGSERWHVTGSISGDLGTAVTGIPFVKPNFSFTIPQKLPIEYSTKKGRFDVTDISYATRLSSETPPPICPVALSLGPAAVDQTITLEYTARPSGNCLCTDLDVPDLNTDCLGVANGGEGDAMYQNDVVARLVDLYAWQASTVRNFSSYTGDRYGHARQAPFIEAPKSNTYQSSSSDIGTPTSFTVNGFWPQFTVQESLIDLVEGFERAIALLDATDNGGPGSPNYRDSGLSIWDEAVAELKSDVGAASTLAQTVTAVTLDTLAQGDAVTIVTDNTGAQKVKKGIAPISFGANVLPSYGFVDAAFTAGQTATVYRWGIVTTSGLTAGTAYNGTATGTWTFGVSNLTGYAVSTTQIVITPPANSASNPVYWGLLPARYNARLKHALISGGVSPLGKSDASSVEDSGDGCWQDWGDANYWTVVGSDAGAYAPAFNNHPYYSSRKATETGKYFSTHEFAFQLNIKCTTDLRVGDRITLVIGAAAWGTTYQNGDELDLPIIAAAPIAFAGGSNGDDTQTWYVAGDVDGAFPSYLLGGSPVAYDEDGLQFQIVPGGVPFAVGDKFQFAVVGGHYRWRKTVAGVPGSWSSSQDIVGSPVTLSDGLSLKFTHGVQPSIVQGDRYLFRALQPWAPTNVRSPDRARWQWDTSSPDAATLVLDCGAPVPIEAVAAWHTLPAGAVLTLEGGNTAGVYDWSEAIAYHPVALYAELATPRLSRYYRWTVDNAAGGGVMWLWGGLPFVPSLSADSILRHDFSMRRADTSGLLQGGVFRGSAKSCIVSWTEGALKEADYAGLAALLYWVKSHQDEPIVFVPQYTRPEVVVARIQDDETEISEVSAYNRDASFERRFSARLQLQGVWTQ